MQNTIVSGVPEGRIELPHAGQRLEALPGESFDIALSNARVASLAVVEGDASAIENRVIFGSTAGPVTVQINGEHGTPSTVRFMVCSSDAVDWIPDSKDESGAIQTRGRQSTPTMRKRLILRGLSQAPWFDGTKASMMGRSLAEYGA